MSRQRYDVIVVGGGAVGVCTAYHLAQHTDSVGLFEADRIGRGSTGLSAGGIRQQLPAEREVRLAMDSVEQFQQFGRRTDRVAFEQHGYLVLARTDREAARLETDARMQREIGLDVTSVPPNSVGAYAPFLRTDDLVGANYCPTDGVANPRAFVEWLANRAEERGVDVHQRTPVTRIRTRHGRATGVEADGDRYDADHVVVATGIWSNELASPIGDELPIEPVRIQIVKTEVNPAVAETDPFVVDLHEEVLFRPENGALLVCGQGSASTPASLHAYERSYDRSFGTRVQAYLRRRTAGLGASDIVSGWAGLKGITPDGLPLVGPYPGVGGLSVAAGFNGHGFMLAPAVGRELGAFVATGNWQTVDLEAFAPGRFTDR